PPSLFPGARAPRLLPPLPTRRSSDLITSRAGDRNAKLEPRYAGAFPFVIRINSSVPTPFIKSTTAGLIPNIKGTSTDAPNMANRSEEHTSELQSRFDLVCRLLLETKK